MVSRKLLNFSLCTFLLIGVPGLRAQLKTKVELRDDRGQQVMTAKVYEMRYLAAGDLIPFVESVVKAMNPAAMAIAGKKEGKSFLTVTMPVYAVSQVDAMIEKLDRPGGMAGEPNGIVGSGETRGVYMPKHRSSQSMLRVLRSVTEGEAKIFRDEQTGMIYWRASASKDTEIREMLAQLDAAPAGNDDSETIHIIQSNADPKLITKTYILKHADPYEIRGLLRETVGASRITGARTGVECVKYNDGTGVLIVTAEDYRFGKQAGSSMSIDELVAKLDQPDATAAGDDAAIFFPQHRSATELAEQLENVGITRPDDTQELSSGTSGVYVDSELNALIVDAPPFDRKNARNWIAVHDRGPAAVQITLKVYELLVDNAEVLGNDYQAWRNGPGRELFTAGLRQDSHGSTRYVRFAPQWNTGFFDFLVSNNKASLMTEAFATVQNRRQHTMDCRSQLSPPGGGNPAWSGLTLRLLPMVMSESTSLQLDLAYTSITGWNSDASPRTSRSGFSTRIQVPSRGGSAVIGGLTRQEATGSGGSSFFGRLFGGGSGSLRENELVVVIECRPDSPDAGIPPQVEKIIRELDD